MPMLDAATHQITLSGARWLQIIYELNMRVDGRQATQKYQSHYH